MTPAKTTRHDLGLRVTILDRYVAREYLFGYAVALFVVLLLRVLIDLFLFFDEFVETDAAGGAGGALVVVSYIGDYYLPKLFEYFRDFSGMIILLAATFSLMRMTRQNELTAVLASGVSLKRVLAPIVVLGFALNLLMVLDQELVLPRLADKLVRKQDDVTRVRTVPVWFLPDKGESLLCARRFHRQESAMEDMLVILRDEQQMAGRITAEYAYWNEATRVWDLVDGRYYGRGADGGDGFDYEPIGVYESTLSAEDIWVLRNGEAKSLMSSAGLNALLQRRLKPDDRLEAISEKHFRFTDPIVNMIILLLGLPMLVSREHRSQRRLILLGVTGAGGCFVATFACKLLVGSGLGPLWAAWLPIIVFLPLSVLTLDAVKT